ncbi:MAG TPA: hypothetical protein VIF60_06375 [Burkholderiaceae bacterium]
MKNALHFIGIAGIGWLADTAVFLVVVWLLHGTPFFANLAGGLLGASITFLAARERIFIERTGRTSVRLGVYLAYTLLLLFVASAAVQGVAMVLGQAVHAIPAQWAALLAKFIVTPFTLALNFVTAKFLNTR